MYRAVMYDNVVGDTFIRDFTKVGEMLTYLRQLRQDTSIEIIGVQLRKTDGFWIPGGVR